jgi:hypothetical protein
LTPAAARSFRADVGRNDVAQGWHIYTLGRDR